MYQLRANLSFILLALKSNFHRKFIKFKMSKCCWKSICINWLKIFRKEPFYTLKCKNFKSDIIFLNNAKYGGRTVVKVYLTKNPRTKRLLRTTATIQVISRSLAFIRRKKHSVKSGIIFHIERNIARAYRDAKCAFVCLAVKME